MALGCLSFLAASNLILVTTGVLSLPLYFSFFGSEAAARFSLLLCLHSIIMAVIPEVLVSKLCYDVKETNRDLYLACIIEGTCYNLKKMKCPIRQKKANVCLLSFDSQTTLLPLQQSCCCFQLFYLTCCVEICSRQRSFLLTTILLFLFYFVLFFYPEICYSHAAVAIICWSSSSSFQLNTSIHSLGLSEIPSLVRVRIFGD